MVDFKKRLGKKESGKLLDLLAIYETLDRASDKGPLRPARRIFRRLHQGDDPPRVPLRLRHRLRYAQKGTLDTARVQELADGLTQRQYQLIEGVEGRVYFHVPGASARDVALLSLWHKHPSRMSPDELIAAVMRHQFTKGNATKAVNRLGGLVDRDEHGRLRLLHPGMRLAEELVRSAKVQKD